MSGAQIHLIFNHFPLVLSLLAFLLLAFGVFKKLTIIVKTGLVLNLLAFVLTFPLYLSGENAEETVKHYEHVSHDYIHEHEEMAEKAFTYSFILAIVSLAAFLNFPERISNLLPKIALAASFVALLLYSITAHFGGRISHPEIRESGKTLEKSQLE